MGRAHDNELCLSCAGMRGKRCWRALSDVLDFDLVPGFNKMMDVVLAELRTKKIAKN